MNRYEIDRLANMFPNAKALAAAVPRMHSVQGAQLGGFMFKIVRGGMGNGYLLWFVPKLKRGLFIAHIAEIAQFLTEQGVDVPDCIKPNKYLGGQENG